MSSIRKVLRYQQYPFLLILIGVNILYGLEAFFHPMLIKWIFDEALGDRNLSRFGFLIAGYLCLSLFINTSHFLLSIWQKRVENFLIRDWELHLLKKMFWVDVSMLRDHSSGYMVSKIHRDTQELITSVIHFLIDTSTRITSTFVFGTVLFVISWKASIILLLIIPPLMIYGRHVGFHVGSLSEKEREAEAQWIKILNQCIESVHWLQSFPDLMEKTFKTARDVLRSYLGRIYEIHRHIKTQHTLNDIVMGISDVVSMSVGAFFVFKGEITFGGYLAFVNAFWRAIQGMVSLMDKIPEYHRVIGIWNTFEKLSHLFPQSPSFSIPPCMDDGIRLSHVRVCKGDVCLLDVPEFAVSAGEKVLIVGPNGSGKTTLIQVIAGLLSPSSGDICRPASTVSLTQPIILPPLEVRSLIPGEIARHIGVEHLLDRTPDRLSMGERTRVALGMLLFSNNSCILLDEPLANLDPKVRQDLFDLLIQHTSGKTLVVVSHFEGIWRPVMDRVVRMQEINRACDHQRSISDEDSL